MIIAVVDDEAPVRKALSRLFTFAGHEATSFATGKLFLESLNVQEPDCIVLDLHLSGLTGMDVLACLAQRKTHIPTIVMTGYDTAGARERALSLGADVYLLKPLDEETLISAIHSSVRQSGINPA